ncbi:MAG: alpha/beta hydrolase family protein [Ignisphaera sp.]
MRVHTEEFIKLLNYFIMENSSAWYTLSYFNGVWKDIYEWKNVAREKLKEILLPRLPIRFSNPSIDEVSKRNNLVVEKISYELPYGSRVEGYFMYPSNNVGKLPGVLALHCHGGFKYFGKEKIVEIDGEPRILRSFKDRLYDGRSWATELARRGFAVLVVDVFLFGSRRIAVRNLAVEANVGIDDEIKKYNEVSYRLENFGAKALLLAGLSIAGIVAYEDLVALEYLINRPEVDPGKIGVCGTSFGGTRGILLSALDDRVKCSIVAAAVTTIDEIIREGIEHTWALYIPEMVKYFDIPDIISLHVPQPLLIQYCKQDPIFPYEGQLKTHEKLAKIYRISGYEQNYKGVFYDKPHVFDLEMQEEAFEWLSKCLGNKNS